MTVQQIIDKLKDRDPDEEVLMQIKHGDRWMFTSIRSIEHKKTSIYSWVAIFPIKPPSDDIRVNHN